MQSINVHVLWYLTHLSFVAQHCQTLMQLRQCVCVCVCVCVCPYGAVVCAVDFQSKHCGFDPRRVRFHTSFFSFSISGWLPTAKCVCLSTCGGKKKEKKKGIVTGCARDALGLIWTTEFRHTKTGWRLMPPLVCRQSPSPAEVLQTPQVQISAQSLRGEALLSMSATSGHRIVIRGGGGQGQGVCVRVCVCVCVCVPARRNCRWPKQPLRAVWCKTRLLNSGGQFDQLCNLIGGAILARSTMLAHSPAIIAYGDGRPRSKVCVCVCVWIHEVEV